MHKNRKVIVADEFKKSIINIFKNNITFAFLCGSFATGRSINKSDIDMVVCLKKRNKKMEGEFLKWYFLIHKKVGLIPDNIYKYEVCDERQLGIFLSYAEKATPTVRINSGRVYSGIVLSGMLSSKTTCFIGDYKKYLFFKKRAYKITKKWKQQIFKFLSDLDADIFLKKVITYERKNF